MEQFVNSLAFTRCHEFPALQDTVYLDHAGATLVSRTQLEAHHQDVLRNIYGNPHSRSASSQLTTDTIDQIRYRILQHFGTTADEYSVIFTAGCTAALKLVAEAFDYHGNLGCCSCRSEKNNLATYCHSNSCYETAVTNSNDGHGKGQCGQEQCSIQSKIYGSKCNKGGSFSYMLDNHTSVQGMREIAFEKAGQVQCLDSDSQDSVHLANVLHVQQDHCACGNHLFAYPAQSNFSGRKYPIQWISLVQNGQMEWQTTIKDLRSRSSCEGHFYTILDAASLVSTSALDLGSVKPDFVALSFYKMFGYPTGLGALLVKNDSAHVLKKTYFGGGTVSVSLSTQPFHVSRSPLSEKFEDGTVSFLDIISMQHGFEALQRLAGGISSISQHTFNLAQYFHHTLSTCCHGSGTRLAEIYCDGDFMDIQKQGAIVSFNLLRANGDYVGFSEVDKLAQLYNIHVRTGCFCNIGACQKYLGLSDDKIKHNFDAGHVCGDDRDLVDGKPTGAVRVSFGYMSTLEDAQRCLQFIVDCFLESVPKPVFWDKNIKIQNHSGSIYSQSLISGTKGEEQVVIETVSSADSKQKFDTDVEESSNDSGEKETVEEKCETEQLKKRVILTKCLDPKFEKSATIPHSDIYEKKIQSLNMEETGNNEMFTSCEGKHLTEIYLYPVKSCAAFKVNEWPLCDRGLLYDREWMIVTESGIAMSQKRESRLCLIKPSIDLNKNHLLLDFPGMETMCVSLNVTQQHEMETNLCNSKVCGDRVQSLDCGSVVADWLSEALCRPGCRLIRQATDDKRASKLKNNGDLTVEDKSRLSLANESQYLLISRDSVAALHQKILDRREEGDTLESFNIDNLVDRFRANLIVSGCDPFEEEGWKSIQIGILHFKSQGTCTRCQMVCLDQQTGERSKEPLKTLAVWRGTKVPFGIHLHRSCSGQHSSSVIKVGDPVFTS
ncbi:molybdenum cofactor sulfurase-like [Mercenaria mercenaria]|uniref:molybdenum cofactor sulfurase-like n=1 Tax=Mercenaria mercenaria TaxID=6596 RepID=UPI00234FA669|nr:molybdenum cofactor sulfurase-like [Mercenaria mercenaria]